MTVTLIDFTADAVNKLLITKATRLTDAEREKLLASTDEEKLQHLDYMSMTVPSSWEFVTYTFEIRGVTRAFTHQLVRTRTGSYAQQAMRINHMKQFSYETGPSIANDPNRQKLYDIAMSEIQAAYDTLIQLGADVQDARGLLPTNIHTNIIAQFNLRALSDLVKKRSGQRVQDEYRAVLFEMVQRVLEVHPWAEKFLYPKKMECIKQLEGLINNVRCIIGTDVATDFHKMLDKWRQE